MLQAPIITDTLPIKDANLHDITVCTPHSINEMIRVVESAIQTGFEAEPLTNILDCLPKYIPSLQKVSSEPPTYAPPSPPLTSQHSNSASVSSVPSDNPSSTSTSSLTLSEILNYWWVTEKTYVIELSIFQELLLRGALVSQLSASTLETISRCISIFITASTSIINTFEMHIPQHLSETLINIIPVFTDTVLESFESYISVYTLKLDDQYLNIDNQKWLATALYNCGIFQSTSLKKSQWLLSSPLHRIKIYTRIFRKFLYTLADTDDKLSEQFSYAYQCFHLLLSKARGHIKIIREKMIHTSMPNIEILPNITNSAREIEKELDISKIRDLFTLQPKKYILDLQPPQLPFVRSVVGRSNFLFKMVHSITGETIQKNIELILLTDIILFLDIEIPKFKYLMFQPFLSRIFKVVETDDERTFMLSIYDREHIYLTAFNKKSKKLWVNLLSSTRAVQNINYSTFKLSPVGNPIIPKNTQSFPSIFDEMHYRLSSDLTPFKKILLPSRSLRLHNYQDKSHIKQLPTVSENAFPTINNTGLDDNPENSNRLMPTNQSNFAIQNKYETVLPKSTENVQKTMPKTIFNQSGLNIHSFPQPPDRTSNGLFLFSDKNVRLNNYPTSHAFTKISKIRLETLPEENESFIENPKSPSIHDNKSIEQKESSEKITSVNLESNFSSLNETSTSSLVNKCDSIPTSKSSSINTDSKESESQQSCPSYQDSISHSATGSSTSTFSKLSSQDSEKDKTESDVTDSIKDPTLLSDMNINTSQAFIAPQLPMPDLGRTSLISMIFNDSILGLSYSDCNMEKTSKTSNENNPSHTEIMFRNSKLIDQLPPSFSCDNSEILFCEKAITFFWNSTFWKSVFSPEEKVFLIIKYTCKTDMFTLEIYSLSSQEVVVCGELQRFSTIVRQSKRDISIACFIQDHVSYILSQFENDSDADLFYIIIYRIINRDNPWILQVFQNHTPMNHNYNASSYPLNTTSNSTNPSTISSDKAGLILKKIKAKVFLQVNVDQWQCLGSGILWITALDSNSKKNVLVAKKLRRRNMSSTILNGIVSRSECRRSGKTGVIMKCFNELTNEALLYMIKVKNEKQAVSIVDILNN